MFENSTKRPIFLDGCNVGFNHSQHNNFSVEGLEIALNTLASLGYMALAVVPRNKYDFVTLFGWIIRIKCIYAISRLTDRRTTNPNLLRRLENDDRLIFTPFDNKYGTCNAAYDDRCTLDLAVKHDAAIISNDQFRDIINEKQGTFAAWLLDSL